MRALSGVEISHTETFVFQKDSVLSVSLSFIVSLAIYFWSKTRGLPRRAQTQLHVAFLLFYESNQKTQI